jgi:hypothetical protein
MVRRDALKRRRRYMGNQERLEALLQAKYGGDVVT